MEPAGGGAAMRAGRASLNPGSPDPGAPVVLRPRNGVSRDPQPQKILRIPTILLFSTGSRFGIPDNSRVGPDSRKPWGGEHDPRSPGWHVADWHAARVERIVRPAPHYTDGIGCDPIRRANEPAPESRGVAPADPLRQRLRCARGRVGPALSQELGCRRGERAD